MIVKPKFVLWYVPAIITANKQIKSTYLLKFSQIKLYFTKISANINQFWSLSENIVCFFWSCVLLRVKWFISREWFDIPSIMTRDWFDDVRKFAMVINSITVALKELASGFYAVPIIIMYQVCLVTIIIPHMDIQSPIYIVS